jgi:hypothetical protein
MKLLSLSAGIVLVSSAGAIRLRGKDSEMERSSQKAFTYSYDSISDIVDTPMTASANRALIGGMRKIAKSVNGLVSAHRAGSVVEEKPEFIEEKAKERVESVSIADRYAFANDEETTLDVKMNAKRAESALEEVKIRTQQISKISDSFHGVLDKLHSLFGSKKALQTPPPAPAAEKPAEGHSFWLFFLGAMAVTVLAYVGYTQYGAGSSEVSLPGSPAKGSSQPYPVAAEKVKSSVPSTTPDLRGGKKKSGGKAKP